jgi:hypothetical protein
MWASASNTPTANEDVVVVVLGEVDGAVHLQHDVLSFRSAFHSSFGAAADKGCVIVREPGLLMLVSGALQ